MEAAAEAVVFGGRAEGRGVEAEVEVEVEEEVELEPEVVHCYCLRKYMQRKSLR